MSRINTCGDEKNDKVFERVTQLSVPLLAHRRGVTCAQRRAEQMSPSEPDGWLTKPAVSDLHDQERWDLITVSFLNVENRGGLKQAESCFSLLVGHSHAYEGDKSRL